MAYVRPQSQLQRVGLYALILLALAMVSMVAYVLLSEDDRGRIADVPEQPAVPLANPPVLDFPERLRTFDPTLNRFIDRFIRTTLAGRYDEFREMWTRRLDPINAERYLQIWKAVREVHVLSIDPLHRNDAVRQAHDSAGEFDAYLITAEVKHDAVKSPPKHLADAVRSIRVIREGDEWAFAPSEKNDRQAVSRLAATQPYGTTRPSHIER